MNRNGYQMLQNNTVNITCKLSYVHITLMESVNYRMPIFAPINVPRLNIYNRSLNSINFQNSLWFIFESFRSMSTIVLRILCNYMDNI